MTFEVPTLLLVLPLVAVVWIAWTALSYRVIWWLVHRAERRVYAHYEAKVAKTRQGIE